MKKLFLFIKTFRRIRKERSKARFDALYERALPLRVAKKNTISALAGIGRQYKALRYPILAVLAVFIFIYNLFLYAFLHLKMRERLARGMAVVMTAALVITSIDLTVFATMAQDGWKDTWTITDVGNVEDLEVPYGTKAKNIELPDKLPVTVSYEVEEAVTEEQENVTEAIGDTQETEAAEPETEIVEATQETEAAEPETELAEAVQETEAAEPETEIVEAAQKTEAAEPETELAEAVQETEAAEQETEIAEAAQETEIAEAAQETEAAEQETEAAEPETEIVEAAQETEIAEDTQETEAAEQETEAVEEIQTAEVPEETTGAQTQLVTKTEQIEVAVSWSCDSYDAKTPGKYVFDASLSKSTYEGHGLALDAVLPSVTVTVLEPEQFLAKQVVDGIEVSLVADEGVFPADASLVVSRIDDKQSVEAIENAIQDKIDEESDNPKTVEESVILDITVLDKDGNAIQPEKEGAKLFFRNIPLAENDGTNENLDIYYVDDAYENAELVESVVEDGSLSFEPEHFSTYSITKTTTAAIFETIGIDADSLNANAIWGETEDFSAVKSSGGLDYYAAFYADTHETTGGIKSETYTVGSMEPTAPDDATIQVKLGSLTTDSGVPYVFSQSGEGVLDGNDCIRLSSSKASASVNLASYGSYRTIYVLGTAGGPGAGHYADFSVTLHYTDGSTGTYNYKLYDWYDSSVTSVNPDVELYAPLRRIQLSTESYDGSTVSGPYLQSAAIPADPTKLLSSIDFVAKGKDGSGSMYGIYCGIFAVTGAKSTNVPGAPTAYSTEDNLTDQCTLRWSKVSGATGYVVDISEDRDFSSYVIANYTDEKNNTTTYKFTNYLVPNANTDDNMVYATVYGLEAEKKYYYRVRAINEEGQSVSSNIISFTLPGVLLQLDTSSKLEIALALGTTKVDSAAFETELRAALERKGIASERISFAKVDANASTSTSKFDWWKYDHTATNASNIKRDNTNHIYTEPNSSSEYSDDNLTSHIAESSGSMVFKGYGSNAYTDWFYQPNEQATQKQIQFTLQEDAYDALDSFGFLINCSITGNYTNSTSNKQRLNGYLVAFEYENQTVDKVYAGVGKRITLYKLDNVDTYQFHHGTPTQIRYWNNSNGYGTITAIASSNVYDIGIQKAYRKVKIEVMPTYIKIWLASGSASSVFNQTLGSSNLVSFTAKSNVTGATSGSNYTEFPLTAGYDNKTYRGGFGPLGSYQSHSCSQQTRVTLSNLSMTADYVRSLTEVVREPNWSDDALSYLVNLNEASIDDFSNVYSTAEIINRLTEDDVTYIGWCGNDNKSASQAFVDGAGNSSALVSVNEYADASGNAYTKEARQRQIDAIAEAIIARLKRTILPSTGGEVSKGTYTSESDFSFTSTGTSLDDGNWSVGYSETDFDTCKDNIQTYKDLSTASFATAGYYEVYYNGELKSQIRIHDAPQAILNVNVKNSVLEIENKSYDPDTVKKDNLEIANADGSVTYGIDTEKTVLEYKKLSDSTAQWTTSKPETVAAGETWIVRLTVTDVEGSSASTTRQVSIAGSGSQNIAAPYGSFRLSKSVYTKTTEINTTGFDTNLVITDQSYSLDGSTFTTAYVLTNASGGTVATFAVTPGATYEYPLSGLNGNYTLSMTATLTVGNVTKTSAKVSRNFSVKTGYLVTYDANGGTGAPGNQYKNSGETLTLSKNAPARTGYTFAGWATSKANADAYTVNYATGASYSLNASLNLYAVWLKNMTVSAQGSTVTYDGNLHGITVTATDPGDGYSVTYGTSANNCTSGTLTYSKPGKYTVYYKVAKTGYQTASGSRVVEIRKAAVSIDLEDTDVSYSRTQTGRIADAKVTAVDNKYAAVEYTYYTDADCSKLTSTSDGAKGAGKEPQKAGTYYVKATIAENDYYKEGTSNIAVLNILLYTVKFDVNGNTYSKNEPKPLTNQVAGDKITAPTPIPKSEDSVLVGWYKEPELENEWNFAEDTIAGDTVLYAKWRLKSDYPAYWKVEGEDDYCYGEVEEAVEIINKQDKPGISNIQIQKDADITDLTIPKDVTVGIKPDANVTLRGTTTINGTLENRGTITNTGTINGDVDNTNGTISGGTINGNVTNSDGTLSGVTLGKGSTAAGGSYKDVINNGTITDGKISGNSTNSGTISGGTISGTLKNEGGTVNGATLEKGTEATGGFYRDVTNNGSISGGSFSGETTNNGSISGGTVAGTLNNGNGTVSDVTIAAGATANGGSYKNVTNNGSISDGKLSGENTNNGTISGGTISGNLNNENGTVSGSTLTENASATGGSYTDTTNNGTISGGKFSGSTKNNGTVTDSKIAGNFDNENGSITGATTNSGAISGGSIAGTLDNADGTVNGSTFEKGTTATGGSYKSVTNNGNISDGKFSGETTNNGTVTGGKFSGETTNNGTVTDAEIAGSFNNANGSVSGDITNKGTISGGTVSGKLNNENGTVSGSTLTEGTTATGGSYDDVTNNGSVTGGKFSGETTNNGTVTDAEIAGNFNNANGSVSGDITNKGTISGGSITGTLDNADGIVSGSTLAAGTTAEGGSYKDVTNNGSISDGKFSGNTTNNGTVTGGEIAGTFNNANGTVTGATVAEGAEATGGSYTNVTNDGNITGGKFSGNTTNNGSVTGGKFSGDITNNGTVTDSEISGTFNNEKGTVAGDTTNNGTISGGTVSGNLNNENGSVNGSTLAEGTTAIGGSYKDTTNNGSVTEGKFSGDTINNGKVTGSVISGTFNNEKGSVAGDTTNNGTISGGTVSGNLNNENGTISGSTLAEGTTATGGSYKDTTNNGSVSDGKFSGDTTNNGTVTGSEISGTFNNEKGSVAGDTTNSGTISGGNIAGNLNNENGTVSGSTLAEGTTATGGSYKDTTNNGSVSGGKFSGDTINNGTVKDAEIAGSFDNEKGSLTGNTTNNGTISGGAIAGSLNNAGGTVNGATLAGGTTATGGTYENVTNNGSISDGSVGGSSTNNGSISGSNISGTTTNNGNISGGTVGGTLNNANGSVSGSTIAAGANASGGSYDNVINNGNISGGSLSGSTTNNGAITGSNISGTTTNNGNIAGGTVSGTLNNANGTVTGSTIAAGTTATGGEYEGVTNNGTISKGTLSGNTTNTGTISASEINGTTTNAGSILNGTLNGTLNNANGTVSGTTIAAGATATGGKYENVTNNGTISGGAVSGNTVNNGSIKQSTLKGSVTNNGLISDSTIRATVANAAGTISGGTIAKSATVTGGTVDSSVTVRGTVINDSTKEDEQKKDDKKKDDKKKDDKKKGDSETKKEDTSSEDTASSESESTSDEADREDSQTGGTNEQQTGTPDSNGTSAPANEQENGNNPDNSSQENVADGADTEDTSDAVNPSTDEGNTGAEASDEEYTARIVYDENPTATIEENTLIDYGIGQVKVVLKVVNEQNEETGDILKGVLLSSADNVINACLTKEEKATIQDGDSVEVRVVVTKCTQNVNQESKSLITDKVASLSEQYAGLTLGDFFDIDIQKRVGEAEWERLSELNEEIEICFDIPEETYAENRTYAVIREHEGSCELLEDHDDVSRTFTMRSRLFSTYALVYTEESTFTDSAVTGSGKLPCFWHMLIWLVAICGAILSFLFGKRKKAEYIIMAAELLLSVIFAILGSCIFDLVALAVVIVLILLQWWLFVKPVTKKI